MAIPRPILQEAEIEAFVLNAADNANAHGVRAIVSQQFGTSNNSGEKTVATLSDRRDERSWFDLLIDVVCQTRLVTAVQMEFKDVTGSQLVPKTTGVCH